MIGVIAVVAVKVCTYAVDAFLVIVACADIAG